MTRQQFRATLEPLVVAMRADFDEPTWLVYYQALSDVPLATFRAAVVRVSRGVSPFFPKPGELRAHAEEARKELSAARPFNGCEECQGTGWLTVCDAVNVPRVTRCACWKAHQQALTSAGLTTPIALPDVALLPAGEP